MCDPILTSTNKFIYYPIKYPRLYEYFKKAEASFWTTSEVDLASDLNDFESLNARERSFLLTILSLLLLLKEEHHKQWLRIDADRNKQTKWVTQVPYQMCCQGGMCLLFLRK